MKLKKRKIQIQLSSWCVLGMFCIYLILNDHEASSIGFIGMPDYFQQMQYILLRVIYALPIILLVASVVGVVVNAVQLIKYVKEERQNEG